MASFKIISSSYSNYHVRSISLPARSHPSTIRFEQLLNKLKSWGSTSSSNAEKLCASLLGLGELYECIVDILALPQSQHVLIQHQHEPWITELLERSVRFIDVCSASNETVLMMKQGLRELQSALRRSMVLELSSDQENAVAAYFCYRKKVQKEIAKTMGMLKNLDHGKFVRLSDQPFSCFADPEMSILLRVLTEASQMTISIVQSLLLFLSVPVLKPKPSSKWSVVSKLVQKAGFESRRNYGFSEVESVDDSVSKLLVSQGSSGHVGEESIELAQKRLEILDVVIESLENGLEVLYRHLIRTRVSFLNILSQ